MVYIHAHNFRVNFSGVAKIYSLITTLFYPPSLIRTSDTMLFSERSSRTLTSEDGSTPKLYIIMLGPMRFWYGTVYNHNAVSIIVQWVKSRCYQMLPHCCNMGRILLTTQTVCLIGYMIGVSVSFSRPVAGLLADTMRHTTVIQPNYHVITMQ